MKTIKYTNQFKKDTKLVKQYKSFSEETFKNYVDLLASGYKLPDNTKDHALSKSSPKHYRGLRDFHLSPDICVVYDINDGEIVLHRIGKHNNLKLTENM